MATKVFITGANGYIGGQLAKSFREAGFRVFGLVRSEEKGAHLAKHEIIPVVGDINQPETYHDALAQSSVIIDTVLDFSQKDVFAANRTLLEATAKSAEAQEVTKTFIYTSGVLVYDDSDLVRDETHSLKSEHLAPVFKARVAFENEVLKHPGVSGIVLRPGFVFGGATGAGNHLHSYFEATTKPKIVIGNDMKGRRWNWIHVADLANGYIKVARHAHRLKGEVFNLVGDSHPTYEEVVLASARAAGFKGTIEYTDVKGTDFISTLANKSVLLTNHKARDLLSWHPHHLGAVDEIDIYYHAWKGGKH